ncbi:MAG: helix-turn-helix domain-containing protein [Gammaproteobacteria bacterium]
MQYKPLMVHLRQRLAIFIKEKRGNIPQREFARKIGVAQSTIMRIENLDQNVTLNTLENLCKVFHADIGDLFPRISTSKDYTRSVPRGLSVPESQRAALLHESKVAPSTAKPSKRKPSDH